MRAREAERDLSVHSVSFGQEYIFTPKQTGFWAEVDKHCVIASFRKPFILEMLSANCRTLLKTVTEILHSLFIVPFHTFT